MATSIRNLAAVATDFPLRSDSVRLANENVLEFSAHRGAAYHDFS